MATERIQIIVSERGSRTVRRSLRGIGEDARRSEGAVLLLRRALGLLGGGLAVRELVNLADAGTRLQNVINIAEGSIGRINDGFNRLIDLSNRSRVGVEGIQQVFLRGSIAARELGASQEDLFTFTELAAKGLAIQGTSAEAARGALTQLGQALGSGIVRAEEFNSILEGAFPIAQAAANGIDAAGGSVARLRQLVITGQITSQQFFDGLLSQAEAIEEQFARANPTISQSLSILRNNVIRVVKQFNDASGVSEALGRAIIFLADNLETMAKAAIFAGGALAAAFIRRRIAVISSYVFEVIALERALGATSTKAALFSASTKGLQGAWRGFNAVLGASPIGRIITLILAAVAALKLFGDQVDLNRESGATLGDAFTASFQLIVEALAPVTQFFADAWRSAIDGVSDNFGSFAGTVGDVLSGILTFVKGVVNAQIALWVGALNAIIAAWEGLGPALKDIGTSAINGLIGIIESGINKIIDAINGIFRGISAAQEFFGLDPIGEIFDPVKLERRTNDFEGAARTLGGNVSEAFTDAFSRDFVGDGINAVLNRADEIAAGRATTDTDTGTAPTIPGGGGGTGGGGKGGDSRSFDEIIAGINRETEALRLNSVEREIANELTDIEKELKRGLTETERGLATEVIRGNLVAQERADILSQTNPPLADLELKLQALNQLFAEGAINALDFNAQLAQLAVQATEADNSVSGGLVNGLARVAAQAGDLGKNISDFVVGAFDKASDAVVEFAKTGEFSFREFFGELSAQLLKIVTNQLFSQLLAGLLGGFGFGGGGGFAASLIGGGNLPGYKNGGSFEVGGSGGPDSQLVAFKASPNERVSVETPAQQKAGAAAAAPPVNNNVNVAAVLNPSDVIGTFDSDEGETMVINLLQRNASTVRSIVSG